MMTARSSMSSGLFDEGQRVMGRSRPTVFGQGMRCGLQYPGAQGLVEQRLFERATRGGNVARRDVECGRTTAFARHLGIEDDGRQAGGKRLERRQTQTFVLGQERKRMGA